MAPKSLTRNQVRSIDRLAVEEFAIPSLVLMENAGRGAAEWLTTQLDPGDRVLILCGPGNNGGDGGVVARHLDVHGILTQVVWFGAPELFSNDARAQYQILHNAGFNQIAEHSFDSGPDIQTRLWTWMERADWLVDALLGTGLNRPVEGTLAQVIGVMNASDRPILAIDLPSGLDANIGQPLGVAVRATTTVTFVAPKVGFSAPGALDYTGPVHLASIGIPRRVLERFDQENLLS